MVPIEICNAFASNCYPNWDGVVAVATASATGAALFIPFWQRRRDKDEKRKALSYSLLFKITKIYNDLRDARFYTGSFRPTDSSSDQIANLTRLFSALANLPSLITFSTEELTVLLSYKDKTAFQLIKGLDETHASIFNVIRVYSAKWEAMMAMLPGGFMNGTTGNTTLSYEQFHNLAPRVAQLYQLAGEIVLKIKEELPRSTEALMVFAKVLREKMGFKIDINFPEPSVDLTA